MPYIIHPREENRQGAFNYLLAGTAGSVARYSCNTYSNVKIYIQGNAPGSITGCMGSKQFMKDLYGKKVMSNRAASIAAARIFPHYVIKFAVFDRLVSNLGIKDPQAINQLPTLEDFAKCYIAGASAGVAATLVTHPMDVVKVRTVMTPPGADASYKAVTSVLSREGAAVNGGIMFSLWWLYEQLPWRKRGIDPIYGAYDRFYYGFLISDVNLMVSFIAITGMLSGPLDNIRRKQMAQSFLLPKDGNMMIRFRNGFEMLAQSYRYQNIWGVLGGNFANLLKTVPQFVVFMATLKASQAVGYRFTRDHIPKEVPL